MAENVFDVLRERGFIRQTTHEDDIRKLLGDEKVTFYIGFDPTADSLHVGHFIQIVIMMWMQKYGHTPIVLVGGGTTMVGDPSGRTDMRKMMTKDDIIQNGKRFVKLFERFLEFGEIGADGKPAEPGKAILVNNADWLLDLNYVGFIREIGRHFSVNNMLRAECFKSRMEKGLSFLEFNYMLMQSYDFLELYRRHGCKMQFGGDDQWSNIISGVDLIRRELSEQAFGMTFALLTNSKGDKMGKTVEGALWLEPDRCSPYDFYQYWRNVEDADVRACLSMLTFLPMDEVERLSALKDAEINHAKEVLAFEVTKVVHGEDEAARAQEAARALFGGGDGGQEDVPMHELEKEALEGTGLGLAALMTEAGMTSSNSDAFRAIKQGGVTLNGEKIIDSKRMLTEEDFPGGSAMIRKGKKVYTRIVLMTLMLVLSMALALGGCSLFGGGSRDGGSLDLSQYDDGDEATKDEGAEDIFRDEDEYGDEGPQANENFEPIFPEYENHIEWTVLPPDYIGGFGGGLEPKNPNAEYVNIRETPSIDADVVGQLLHGNEEWWIATETFEDDEGFHVGTYSVKSGDYTWLGIASFIGPYEVGQKGWVASEVVVVWGL